MVMYSTKLISKEQAVHTSKADHPEYPKNYLVKSLPINPPIIFNRLPSAGGRSAGSVVRRPVCSCSWERWTFSPASSISESVDIPSSRESLYKKKFLWIGRLIHFNVWNPWRTYLGRSVGNGLSIMLQSGAAEVADGREKRLSAPDCSGRIRGQCVYNTWLNKHKDHQHAQLSVKNVSIGQKMFLHRSQEQPNQVWSIVRRTCKMLPLRVLPSYRASLKRL